MLFDAENLLAGCALGGEGTSPGVLSNLYRKPMHGFGRLVSASNHVDRTKER
jgi:hypothetical protein